MSFVSLFNMYFLGLRWSNKLSFNLNLFFQVQFHMIQQKKHREIQKKHAQQQVQL